MRPRTAIDPRVRELASGPQREYIDAVNKHGSLRGAARALRVNYSTVIGAINRAEAFAASRGVAPAHGMTHEVPAPFMVKGVSTMYGEDGAIKAQWVKSKINPEQFEQTVRDFISDLITDAKGKSLPINPPKFVNEDLLAVYPIGDPHFGMYAWKEEAGQDFDSDIAEKLTKGAIDRLVASTPAAEVGIILPLGDLIHADDSKNRTPQSGNALDVDTRHQKIMRIALRAMKHCIYRALEKHKNVVVRIVRGNHDPHAAFAIALAVSEHFCNNERVTVDLSASLFWYYRHGKTLLGVTHGDTAKGRDLLGVMAADRPEDWGGTKFRYFYHGHLHEKGVKEMPGLLVEWFRTLAPADAWAAGEGYRVGRDMCAVVFHKNFGEVERHRCDVAMLEAA